MKCGIRSVPSSFIGLLNYRINQFCPRTDFRINPKIRFSQNLLSFDKFYGFELPSNPTNYGNPNSAPLRQFKLTEESRLQSVLLNLTKTKLHTPLRTDHYIKIKIWHPLRTIFQKTKIGPLRSSFLTDCRILQINPTVQTNSN